MLAYTTYSEAGGVGKTTTASNLAHAHASNGLKTLVIDLDPQEASISYLFGVDDNRDDSSADNLVRHLAGRGKGPFADLIRKDTGVENIDVIPAHNMLSSLDTTMRRAKETEEQMNPDQDWIEEEQLYQLLGRNGIPDEYDVIICDPQASEGQGLYNAVMVTRTVLIPVELTGKGSLSIDGLEELVDGLEAKLDIDVGVLGIVPVAFGNTTGHKQHLETLQEEVEYDVPAVFGKRESLMQEMWDSRATAYQVVEKAFKNGEKRQRRVPDREHETLEKYDELAADIQEAFNA